MLEAKLIEIENRLTDAENSIKKLNVRNDVIIEVIKKLSSALRDFADVNEDLIKLVEMREHSQKDFNHKTKTALNVLLNQKRL